MKRPRKKKSPPRYATPAGRAADRWLDLAAKVRRAFLSDLISEAAFADSDARALVIDDPAMSARCAADAQAGRAAVAVLRSMRRGVR